MKIEVITMEQALEDEALAHTLYKLTRNYTNGLIDVTEYLQAVYQTTFKYREKSRDIECGVAVSGITDSDK